MRRPILRVALWIGYIRRVLTDAGRGSLFLMEDFVMEDFVATDLALLEWYTALMIASPIRLASGPRCRTISFRFTPAVLLAIRARPYSSPNEIEPFMRLMFIMPVLSCQCRLDLPKPT